MPDATDLPTFDHSATYCPQDDKIRLYLSYKVGKDEWKRLTDAGFSWTMKQDCNLAAVWTPGREDIALELAGELDDEDTPREERAANRAERFEGYLGKREDEADALADRYEAGPSVHGNQSAARAERARARHDRLGSKAVTQWEKAEYWQRRTAGVIGHALYLERPAVRHRRIKGILSDIRGREKGQRESQERYDRWVAIAAMTDTAAQDVAAEIAANHCHAYDFVHPSQPDRRPTSLWSLVDQSQPPEKRITGAQAAALYLGRYKNPTQWENRWLHHLQMRQAYEVQMLAAQGGTLADEVTMEAGGFIGTSQIQKVTKDANGTVSKVYFWGPSRWNRDPNAPQELHGITAESLKPGSYRAPTDEERAAFLAVKKAKSAAKPKGPSLINPTLEAAQRLQDLWNAEALARYNTTKRYAPFIASEVRVMDQAHYTANSGGTYSNLETREIRCTGEVVHNSNMWTADGASKKAIPIACRLRLAPSTDRNGHSWYAPPCVIVISDKPQADLPTFKPYTAPKAAETVTA